MSKLYVFLIIFTLYTGCSSISGIFLTNLQDVVLYQLSSHRNFTRNFCPLFNYKGNFKLSILRRSIHTSKIITACSFKNFVPNQGDVINQQLHRFPSYTSNDYLKIPFIMEYFSKLHYNYPKFRRYINRKIKMDFKRIRTGTYPNLFQNPNVNLFLIEDVLHESFNFEKSLQHRTILLTSSKTEFLKRFGPWRINSPVSTMSKDSKTAGRETRHLRTRRRVQENEDPPIRVKVRFKLEKPVVSSRGTAEVSRHLKMQLAKRMRVPLPSIQDMEIISGIDVSFTLSSFNDENNVMDDQTIVEAADFLRNEIKLQRLRLTDLQGQVLMTTSGAYVSTDDNQMNFSLVVLVVLGITILLVIALIIVMVYLARRLTRMPRTSDRAYRPMDFGRDSSQSVGKYSLDSGLWLGPGPEPLFSVPDAPYYRPPTVDQISSTPRPVTAVRTRLKTNWNVDERALSTIPDDHRRAYATREDNYT